MVARVSKRLQAELAEIQNNFSELMSVQYDDISKWYVTFTCPEGSIYGGETYTLEFKFDDTYPIESPEVVFHGASPDHEHVYSSGYIRLSVLYDDWSPALKGSQVVHSIISMMASADKNLSQKMMQVSCRWQMDGVLNRCSKTLLANLQITFIMFLTSSRRMSTPFPSNPTEFPCCMTNFGFISIMVYFSRSPR